MYTDSEMTLATALHVALHCEEKLHQFNLVYCCHHVAFATATFKTDSINDVDKKVFETMADCSVSSLCLFGPEAARIATIYVNVDD